MPEREREPSPPICASCLCQHVRLSSDVRVERRWRLIGLIEGAPADFRQYCIDLFDHITLGRKTFRRDEPQNHPAPELPTTWSSQGIGLAYRTTLMTAFGVDQ